MSRERRIVFEPAGKVWGIPFLWLEVSRGKGQVEGEAREFFRAAAPEIGIVWRRLGFIPVYGPIASLIFGPAVAD
jgi:hypothetical protein